MRELFAGLDLDEGEVVGGVLIEDARFVLRFVGEGDAELGTGRGTDLAHDVIVGENLTVVIDQKAGADAARRHGAVEPVVLIGSGGDVHRGGIGRLIDVDAIHLVGAEAGGAGDFGSVPDTGEAAGRAGLAMNELAEPRVGHGGA